MCGWLLGINECGRHAYVRGHVPLTGALGREALCRQCVHYEEWEGRSLTLIA